jgi:hypothetical protein
VNAVEAREAPKLLEYRARRQAKAQRLFESALSALVTMQKLFPAEPAGTPTPVEVADAAALPAGDRPAEVGCGDTPGDMPNRVEAFFAAAAGGRWAAERVPVGTTD